ncbi:MAG TPA: Imm27 family immunity protein [Thermoanaerobaculia bacterium]|nr:Imm27 family immunity protein [Thermoanaerobaculia bacterium]
MNGDLQPQENELRGSFLREGCRTRGDTVCARIEWLRTERLERIAVSRTGWDTLYRDPRDGRYWELHVDNGPPVLRVIDPAATNGKY